MAHSVGLEQRKLLFLPVAELQGVPAAGVPARAELTADQRDFPEDLIELIEAKAKRG